MAVRYKREYSHIIDDMAEALKRIEDNYTFLNMKEDQWKGLEDKVRGECLKTMSHDIIYGLGTQAQIYVGQGLVKYEPDLEQIRIFDGVKAVYVVRL